MLLKLHFCPKVSGKCVEHVLEVSMHSGECPEKQVLDTLKLGVGNLSGMSPTFDMSN